MIKENTFYVQLEREREKERLDMKRRIEQLKRTTEEETEEAKKKVNIVMHLREYYNLNVKSHKFYCKYLNINYRKIFIQFMVYFQVSELQCDLLELRDAHAKLRTANEKLRRDKERHDRDRDQNKLLVASLKRAQQVFVLYDK